jgi:hypothetical protein
MSYEPVGNFYSDSRFLDRAEAFIVDEHNSTRERLAMLKKFDQAMGTTEASYTEEDLDGFITAWRDNNSVAEDDSFSVETPDWMDYEIDMEKYGEKKLRK